MSTIYILQLQHGKYYVGKTDDIQKRFEQHLNGKGSAWTKEHSPIKIVETRQITSSYDETNITKDYMKKYGIENVRGGAYCAVDMTEEQETSIRHEIRSNDDKCYTCGKPGHFANRCKGKSSFTGTCECGSKFLDFEEFMNHMKGCKIRNAIYECQYCKRNYSNESQASSCQCKFAKIARQAGIIKLEKKQAYTLKTQSGKCYRCGRSGHWATSCYARTHVDGEQLDSDDE